MTSKVEAVLGLGRRRCDRHEDRSGGPVQPPDKRSKPGKTVATALASPGLFGTWPMIDYCRGYAYIVFVKTLLGDERANAHEELKAIIDRQITSNCR